MCNYFLLQAFLKSHLEEGKVLAQYIGRYIKRLNTAEGKELKSNSLYNKVNEAIDNMLKIKVSTLSQPQTQNISDEDLSDELFWGEACKCLEEIEKTIKAKKDLEETERTEEENEITEEGHVRTEEEFQRTEEDNERTKKRRSMEIPSFDLGLDLSQVMEEINQHQEVEKESTMMEEVVHNQEVEHQDEEPVQVRNMSANRYVVCATIFVFCACSFLLWFVQISVACAIVFPVMCR